MESENLSSLIRLSVLDGKKTDISKDAPVKGNSGLQIRVRIGKLFSLFLIQNICCGYSKELSQ